MKHMDRMTEMNQPAGASSALARRALFVTLSLALAGAGIGVLSMRMGMVAGAEAGLVTGSCVVSAGGLLTLFFWRRVAVQTIATVTTSLLTINLIAGMLIAVCGTKNHINLFVYLFWFFPLLVFNKLVNKPSVGRLLAKVLLVGPILLIVGLIPWLKSIYAVEQRIVVGVFCVAYGCYGLTLNIVTRYRERYIVEQERMESMKLSGKVLEEANRSLQQQAELLDKAQDAIVVVDMDLRLAYWNKGAERLYGWSAEEVLGRPIQEIFEGESKEAKTRLAALYEGGEWSGEATQCRKDGSTLIIESRRTIVKDDEGVPRAIFSINTDITARKANEARIDYLAFYDVLTELPNRQLLRLRLSEALERATERNSLGALLYIDLDDFKTLNETMGHDAGDDLLRQVAGRLTRCVPAGYTVARPGGDEFVVMLEELGDDPEMAAGTAKVFGDHILGLFREPFEVGSYQSYAQVSIGVTVFRGAPETMDDLMKQADLAMYAAKAGGRNRMCFFTAAMQAEVAGRAWLRADLRRALANDEFELHYQPQVDGAGMVTGAEALVRWFHPTRGNVLPSEFIPLAEEAGLIVELGRWVLETACTQIARWSNTPAMEPVTVSVNVSLRQFFDPHFMHRVEDTLRTSAANPQRLTLEITESSVMHKVEDVIVKMKKIRALGVSFSLDDFGTGYSSLSHLQHLPLQHLKIDRSFVKNVLTDAKDASIVRTIILLGRSLHLAVIAEGVETVPQRDFLMRKGCHLYQGYLFGAAMTSRNFEGFVAASTKAMAVATGSVLAA
jgi:diguanylate cyclase (GGDEF)-like protein/PAS domain S-box-containing protein